MKRLLKDRWLGVFGALLLLGALCLAAVALADNVVNNVAANPGSDTITAGGSTVVGYQVTPGSAGDTQSGCNASDGTPVTINISAAADVTASPSSLTFSACNSFKNVTFSSSTPGAYVIEVGSWSDSGTGSYKTDPATFTLHVVAPPVPADTTAPTIELVTPPDKAEYPQGESALAEYSCADEAGGSGLASCDGDVAAGEAIDTSTLGSHSFTVHAEDNAGNKASVEHEYIVVDITPPSIECGEADGSWHAEDVSIPCTATDSGSGLKESSDESFSLSTAVPNGTEEENAFTESHEVCDNAGNCAVAGPIGGNKVDKKGPDVTCGAAPTFTLNQAGAQVSATVTDGGSGAAESPVSASAGTSAVGPHTANVTGSDNVGNITTVACPYSVVYDWHGFFSPVNNPGVLNVAKAGSAIPVKFGLSGNQGLSIFESGYPKSAQMSCESTASLDGIEETVTAGGSSLSYDATIDQYIYVWKTEKGWAGTCRQLVVKLIDGTYHRANFKFTK